MPHFTSQYPFEFKIFEWAYAFSVQLTGENRGFLLVLDERGAVRQLWSGEKEGHFDLVLKERLAGENARWLFYHPFGAPEYTFMEWRGLNASVWERLIGKPFDARDLMAAQGGENIEYVPVSWSVMF